MDPTQHVLIVLAIILLSILVYMSTRKVKETFAAAYDQYALQYPYTGHHQDNDNNNDNQLDLKCNISCCAPGKGSNMSCSTGCVCASTRNVDIMHSRGGNATSKDYV